MPVSLTKRVFRVIVAYPAVGQAMAWTQTRAFSDRSTAIRYAVTMRRGGLDVTTVRPPTPDVVFAW